MKEVNTYWTKFKSLKRRNHTIFSVEDLVVKDGDIVRFKEIDACGKETGNAFDVTVTFVTEVDSQGDYIVNYEVKTDEMERL